MKKEEIRNLYNSLIDIHQKLLSLPKDIISGIDPQDIEALEKAVKFLKIFNNNLENFTEATEKIIGNLREYLSPVPEPMPPGPYVVLSLYDNYTFKKPYGFILEDVTYEGLYTWKSLYLKVLEVLKERNIEKFGNLLEDEFFISKRGKHLFKKNKNGLREAGKVGDSFYAEMNLSANGKRKIIIRLLKYFSINPDDMKVYIKRN